MGIDCKLLGGFVVGKCRFPLTRCDLAFALRIRNRIYPLRWKHLHAGKEVHKASEFWQAVNVSIWPSVVKCLLVFSFLTACVSSKDFQKNSYFSCSHQSWALSWKLSLLYKLFSLLSFSLSQWPHLPPDWTEIKFKTFETKSPLPRKLTPGCRFFLYSFPLFLVSLSSLIWVTASAPQLGPVPSLSALLPLEQYL